MKKLKEVWDYLPEIEHVKKYIDIKSGLRIYEVCGKKFQETVSIDYVLLILKSTLSKYGERTNDAEKNNGVDLKAISHAFRVASELSDLYEFGMIRYPLPDFKRIKMMKMGELDFESEVLPDLNSLMDRVHEMSTLSNFPEEVDSEKIEDFLYELLKTIMR